MAVVENITFKGKNINEVWEHAFFKLKHQADIEDPKSSRDGNVASEILNACLIVEDPTRNILTNPIRKMPMRYAVGEFLWYLSGNPSLKAISHYTKAWERMSDDGSTVNSNYGYIIQHCQDTSVCTPNKEVYLNKDTEFNQFEYCYDLLKKDPNSRQAIIHIKTPRDTRIRPTKDLNCTVYCQFFVRENKLYMSTHMRSNDIWMGVPYDCFFFMNLQVIMAMKLGVEIGSYTHYAGSLHMYSRDYEVALKNLEEVSAKNP